MILGLNSTGREIRGTIRSRSSRRSRREAAQLQGRRPRQASHMRSSRPRCSLCRQPGRSGRAAASTPLRAEAPVEPQCDADALDDEVDDISRGVRAQAPPGGR